MSTLLRLEKMIVLLIGMERTNWDLLHERGKNFWKQDKMNYLNSFTRFQIKNERLNPKTGFTVI